MLPIYPLFHPHVDCISILCPVPHHFCELFVQSGTQSLSGRSSLGWRGVSDGLDWTGPSPAECAALQGRSVVIDVAHGPTATQARRAYPQPLKLFAGSSVVWSTGQDRATFNWL